MNFFIPCDPRTCAGGGVDYSEPLETSLVFQPGETRTCISIPIVDDRIPEPEECFFVNAQPQPDIRSLVSITNTTLVCIEDNGKLKYCIYVSNIL